MKRLCAVVLVLVFMCPMAVHANTVVISDSIDSASEVDQWTFSLSATSDVIFDVQAWESCGAKPIPMDFFGDGGNNNKLHANIFLFDQSGTALGYSTGYYINTYPLVTIPGHHDTRSGQNPYIRITLGPGEYKLSLGSYPITQADAWSGTNTDGSDWSTTDWDGNPTYNFYNVIMTAASGTLVVKPAVPVARSATNVAHTSFTANWNAADYAASYRLDVATDIGFQNYVPGYMNRTVSNNTAYTISSLSSNTRYYYRVSAYSSPLESGHSNIVGVRTRTYLLPSVSTNSVSGITSTNANGSGTITGLGDPAATGYGFVWDTSPAPTVSLPTRTSAGSPGLGNFSHALTNLLPGTIYYVRAYATNFVGTAYGSEVQFTTAAIPSSITTLPVNDLMPDMAFVRGDITQVSEPAANQHGFVWNTLPDPTVDLSTKTQLGAVSATGPYADQISGLSADTLYYLRAYTTNTSGTTYGNEVTFRTLGASTVVAPTIFEHPQSRSMNPGQGTAFEVVAYGTPPLLFQWQRYGNDIPGATGSSILFNPVKESDAGQYVCLVSNSAGSVQSQTAVLTVLGPARVQDQPVSQTRYVEQSVSFSVTASGTPPIFYRWLKDGTPIDDAIFSTYSIDNLDMSHAGQYSCWVNNQLGSAYSDPATLTMTLNDVPTITGQNPNPLVTASGGAFTVLLDNLVVDDGNDVFPAGFSLNVMSGDGYTVAGHVVTPLEGFAGNALLVPVSVHDGTDESNIYMLQVAINPFEPVIAEIFDGPESVSSAEDYTLSVGGQGVAAYKYQIDDGAWHLPVDVAVPLEFTLGEGHHTLEVVGSDASGNWQPQNRATTLAWTIDTTPPAAILTNTPVGTVGSTSIHAAVTGQDVRYYRHRLDDGDWGAILPVNQSLVITGLEQGAHTLAVIGMDSAGNWEGTPNPDGTAAWVVDTSVPTAVLSNLPDLVTGNTTASITVSGEAGTPDVDRYKYSIDDGFTWLEEADMVISLGPDDLKEGVNRLMVNAFNQSLDQWQDNDAGESSVNATTFTWHIDLTPPAAPVLQADYAFPATTAAALNWAATEDNLRRYRLYAADHAFDAASLAAVDTYHIGLNPGPEGRVAVYRAEGLSPGTTHYFGVVAEDEAGNLSALSNMAAYTTTDSLPQVMSVSLEGGGSAADNTTARTLVIMGENFVPGDGNVVRFNCPPRIFERPGVAINNSTLTAVVPCGAPVGIYYLKVVNTNGSSRDCASTYTVLPAPAQPPEVIHVRPAAITGDAVASIVITGNNFVVRDAKADAVTLIHAEGQLFPLDTFDVQHSERINAIIPSGVLTKGVYDICVTTINGSNDISTAKVEVVDPIDLSMAGMAGLTSTQGFDMSRLGTGDTTEGVLPVAVTLKTPSRDNHQTLMPGVLKVEAAFAPGTRIYYDDNAAPPRNYDGVVNPPRQIPIPSDLAEKISRPSRAAVFQMGSIHPLKLGDHQTVFVRIDMALPDTSGPPLVYMLTTEGEIHMAGVDGKRQGVDLSRGGTVLGERQGQPEAGYTLYTVGLLVDHLSTFVVGTAKIDDGPSADQPFSVGTDGDSGVGCFIQSAGER